MKGIFFRKPLELNLLVEGESWNQGALISGSLLVKNQGSDDASLEGLGVVLAHGEIKKVREKAPGAFTVLSTVPLEVTHKLGPGLEEKFGWKFQTDRNCPITDKSGSLFLLYGLGEGAEKPAQLQLVVHPDAVIQEFLNVLKTDFRFVVKSQKSSKGAVEVKLAPPASKAFAAVEQLSLLFCFEGERLEIRYIFSVKRVEVLAGAADLIKQKKDFEQVFGPQEYLLPSGRLNHERFETAIREILGKLGLGTVF